MSSEYLREFVNERLTAAAQEILGVFKSTIVKYEEELDRQRRLLAVVWKPRIRLHRIELPQQHVCKEEEVLSEQQLCIEERNSSVDQEEPEPPQIKEEEEELCTSQEGEQFVLKQETDASMLTPTHEERDHSEDQTLNFSPDDTFTAEKEFEVNTPVISSVILEEHNYHQLLSHNFHELPEIHRNTQTELPQQHVCKEEEVLSEQQLCIEEKNSSVDQEEPEPPQIKEEEEELCTSQEGEQLELMQETDASMLTPTHEEREHSEDQTLNFSPDDTFNTETTKTGGIRFYGMSILKIPTGTLKLCSCKICGKDFINRACLRSHSVERLFPCITCGKDFRHRSSVMDHMRLAHANEKT